MATRASDPTRTGAVWVTATGSFLLFAAAVAFVAVRWDQIPDGMKLGALALLSGGLLVAGRPGSALADRHAPAAAGVLFHLGAFLVPVTAYAVLVHLQVPRAVHQLVLGAASAALFHVLGRVERSVVLQWAAAAAVVVATVGLGGLTPLPAAGWLLALSIAALAASREPVAVAWAGLASIVPVAVLLAEEADSYRHPSGWLLDAVAGTGLTPGIVGLGAAAVLVVLTHRLRSLPLLGLAATGLAGGLATMSRQLDPGASTVFLALAAAFALAEVAALLLGDDDFWAEPLDLLAMTAEVFALVPLPLVVGAVLGVPFDAYPAEPAYGGALGLAAVAWLLADLRRAEGAGDAPGLGLLLGGGFGIGTFAATTSVVGATALATASPATTSAVALAVAALLVLSGRAAGLVLVPGLTVLATALVTGDSALVTAVGTVGALVVAWQASLHRDDVAPALAMASLAPAGLVVLHLMVDVDPTVGLLAGLALATALSFVLDQARAGGDLGWIPRLAGTLLLVGLVGLPAREVAVVAGTYLVLATAEALRRDDPLPLLGWAAGLPPFAGALAVVWGLSVPEAGVVLAVLALPLAVAGHRSPVLRLPLLATAASLGVSGLVVGSAEPGVFGTVLLLDGVAAMTLGLVADRPGVLTLGSLAAVVGTWFHLSLHQVEALDAYALPVAAVLWLVASRVADDTVSSWITHGPAIALAGGAALAERIGGGAGAHAVVAGAVGLLAVVEGGGRRLAAPLLLGTGLLIALTGYETTAVTAGVPTWAWLASGGTLLVGAGLVMEHHELGPVETGRRLVDVVHERFR